MTIDVNADNLAKDQPTINIACRGGLKAVDLGLPALKRHGALGNTRHRNDPTFGGGEARHTELIDIGFEICRRSIHRSANVWVTGFQQHSPVSLILAAVFFQPMIEKPMMGGFRSHRGDQGRTLEGTAPIVGAIVAAIVHTGIARLAQERMAEGEAARTPAE
jgi:hypothetical protein